VEARHLRLAVLALERSLSGIQDEDSLYVTGGIVTEHGHSFIARQLISFETALRHELNSLPTYVIEKIGIYDTDDLLTKADNAIAVDLKPFVPPKALDDFKKSGACLAFELYTASGFHGYRAVDETLRSYCRHFTGSLPSRRDWGKSIQAVRSVPVGSARMPNSRTIELIDRLRAEDRNPLIHPETDLDATLHSTPSICAAPRSSLCRWILRMRPKSRVWAAQPDRRLYRALRGFRPCRSCARSPRNARTARDCRACAYRPSGLSSAAPPWSSCLII
jgi:hypothetical protein